MSELGTVEADECVRNVQQWILQPGHLLRLVTLAIVFIFCWRCWFLFQQVQVPHIKVTLSSPSISGKAQLFYDRGYGFNEHDSTVQDRLGREILLWGVIPFPTVFYSTNTAQYCFQVPLDFYSSLSFVLLDQTEEGSEMEKIELVDGLHGHVLEIKGETRKTDDGYRFSAETEGGDFKASVLPGATIHEKIILNPPLNLRQNPGFSVNGYTTRVLLEGAVLAILLVVVILPIRWLLSITGKENGWRFARFIINILFNGKFIFIFVTVLYLYFYPWLNDEVLPVFFEKSLFLFFLIFVGIVILCNKKKFLKFRIISSFVIVYLFIVTSSFLVHYFALNDPDLLSFIRFDYSAGGFYHGDSAGVFFDKFKSISSISDNMVNSDQSAFLFFYPILLLFLVCLFHLVSDGKSILLYLPLLFVPDLISTFYQVGGTGILPIGHVGLSGEIVCFRILLFLIFPVSVLGVIRSGKWLRFFFFILVLLDLWLLRLSYGRAAILGVVLFCAVFPAINLWVHWDRRTARDYLLAGVVVLVGIVLTAGFYFPRFHGAMSVLFPKHFVPSVYSYMKGELQNEAVWARPEMQRQAWRLVKEAPLGGWGPAAFQRNSARVRFNHDEPPGVMHTMTSLYALMATNYGVVGMFLLLPLHLIPLWMLFRVRKRIIEPDERWATGIMGVTVLIMLFLFNTNPHISIPRVNWIYAVFQGFLLFQAFRYGYSSSFRLQKVLFGSVLVGLMLFCAGLYRTSFGSAGYRVVLDDVVSRITRGDTPDKGKVVWNTKQLSGQIVTESRLVHTRGNPLRNRYSTNVFSLKANGDPVRMDLTGDLICIKTTIPDQVTPGTLFVKINVYLDNVLMKEPYLFQMGGEYLVFYRLPHETGSEVDLAVGVDMWKALPFHDDSRSSFSYDQALSHGDYKDVGLSVSVVPYSWQGDS